MNFRDVVTRWLDQAMPHRMPPRLAVVDKGWTGPGEGKYAVDVEIIRPGDHERTGEVLREVPLNPIWAGPNGRGLYSLPSKDQLVIVECLGWDPAFPFISGIYGDRYRAGQYADGQFVLTDGKSSLVLDSDGLWSMATAAGSLKGLLDGIVDQVKGLQVLDPQTAGPTPLYPSTIAALEAFKATIGGVLK
jgi:hypothetical protein